MFHSLFAIVTCVSVGANRIQVDLATTGQTSCETLQLRFQDRVTSLHSSLDAVETESEIGAMSRIRIVSKMYRAVRTMRQARDCSWVLDDSSDDLDQLREVTSSLLTSNPCGYAASLEMQAASAETSATNQMHGLTRAMSILLSDDCEVTQPEHEEEEDTEAQDTDAQFEEAEEELQNRLEELTDASQEPSFVQTESLSASGFLRGVGVIALMLFLASICFPLAALISGLVSQILWVLFAILGSEVNAYGGGLLVSFMSAAGAGLQIAVMVKCLYEVFTTLVPQITQGAANHTVS